METSLLLHDFFRWAVAVMPELNCLSGKGVALLALLSCQIFCFLFLSLQICEQSIALLRRKYIFYAIKAREWNPKYRSAQIIQAAIRGRLKRRSNWEEHRAVALIQSRIRGHLVRGILVQKPEIRGDKKKGYQRGINRHRKISASMPSTEFGKMARHLTRLTMKLSATVLIQTWFRMIRCQREYQRLFSSLRTAPIQNKLPSRKLNRRHANSETSFISNLSSWSSTWTRTGTAAQDTNSINILSSTKSSMSGKLSSGSTNNEAFQASASETEALKFSIVAYASALQIQAWWKNCLTQVRRKREHQQQQQQQQQHEVASLTGTSTSSFEQDISRLYKDNKKPPLKLNMSSMSSHFLLFNRQCHNRTSTGKRHRDESKVDEQYCAHLWNAALEKVGECNNNMCSSGCMDLDCGKEAAPTSSKESAKYEIIYTATETAQKEGCNVVNVMSNIRQHCAASEASEYEDRCIHYAPTGFYQREATSCNTFSTPSINTYTFSSPYTMPSSLDDSLRHDRRTGPGVRFAFCSHNIDLSSSSIDYYYSMDDEDDNDVDGYYETHESATPFYACAI